jgi:hypothetical protein
MRIDGVMLADGGGNELIIEDLAEAGALDGLVGDPAGGLREDGKECGAVRGGEIEADVAMLQEEMPPDGAVAAVALIDERIVDVIDGREEFSGAALDGQGDVGLREILPQGPERRGGQDQVADPLQLQDEDPHGRAEKREAGCTDSR